MSARIAPEPIRSSLYGLGGSLSGAASPTAAPAKPDPEPAEEPKASDVLAPLPAPPAPPGSAFAVALISGQLAPRPTSEREIQLRLGSAELPKQGSLALRDKIV